MRKAQFGFGWDWGPRLPTIGIWRPVELRRERRAAIRGVHVYTLEIDRAGNRAVVVVRVEAERFATDGPLSAAIALAPAPGGETVAEHTLTLEGKEPHLEARAYLVVENPRLWWTHDLGEPALYDLRVSLWQDGEESDRRESRTGIRTLELDQSPDPAERGTRFFRFFLNGVPIFARGANWIPADSSVGAIEDGYYEELLGATKNQHEHAPGVGRRHLRALRPLRPLRPAGPARVAGFHVRLRHLPGGAPAVRSRGGGGGPLPGAPPWQPPLPGAVVRQQREPVDPRSHLLVQAGRQSAGLYLLRRGAAPGW